MEEGSIFTKLGIDWKLLLAQVVNFFLLFFILRKYAYRPILRVLEKREKAIAKSVDDAKQIEQNLASSKTERESALAHTQQEIGQMMQEARKSAETLQLTLREEAQQKVNAMLSKAETDARAMKEKVVEEAQADLAKLVVAASEKIIQQKLSSKQDEALVVGIVKHLKP